MRNEKIAVFQCFSCISIKKTWDYCMDEKKGCIVKKNKTVDLGKVMMLYLLQIVCFKFALH